MSVKLQKEVIKLNEVLCAEYGQTVIENDIIVPDIKPDVLKVLQVDGEAVITQKSIQQDKVVVQGNMRINVLYVPDGEMMGSVKAMSTTQMFTHVVDVRGARPSMSLFAEAEVEDIEFSLLNSRKLSIKATIGANVKVVNPSEIEVATDMQPEYTIQTKGEILRACNTVCETEKEIIIRDQIETPNGKPSISDIFKIDTRIVQKEMRMVENKVVIKGEIELCTLYSAKEFVKNAENEDFDKEIESVHFMEHQIPFNEILELDGINGNMEGDIDYNVKELYFDIQDDANGDRRVLGIELLISASVKASEIIEINSIEDAYSLDGDIEIKKGTYNIEQLIGKSTAQIAHRDVASITDSMPSITQIVNCRTKPIVTGVRLEEGKAMIEGSVESHILYLSKDPASPIANMKHRSDFSHIIDIPGMEDKVVCEAKLDIEHVSYNMTMEREIELRFIFGLMVKAVKATQTEIIEEIEWVENTKIDPRPSIVIYFVQRDDTLWDIAKRYRTTPAAIIENNKLESDVLSVGQQLMIV